MTARIVKVVEIARDHAGSFLVRGPDQDWRRFHFVEDALVDVSLELGERGICVERERADSLIVVDDTIGGLSETKPPEPETKG